MDSEKEMNFENVFKTEPIEISNRLKIDNQSERVQELLWSFGIKNWMNDVNFYSVGVGGGSEEKSEAE